MTLQTLKVDNDGTTLAFSDSGNPGTSDYTTIFALHGICFNGHVFKRIQAIAASNNIRLVSINRRLYKGSTPLTEAEAMILITSSGEEKADFINTRGLEIATFVDSFIQSAQLPPVSSDGKGGVALLGWSAGNLGAVGAIANIDKLPMAAQERFKTHLRALIMQDPPSLIFGLPSPPANWAPQVDTSIPEETRTPMFTRWITSYFDHGDLSTKSWDSLAYVLPSTSRRPTIYAMSAEEITEMIEDTVDEIPGMVMSQTQANAVYRKACYSDEVKALTPHLKTTLLVGEKSCSSALTGLWSVQEEHEAAGAKLKCVLIPGANHFYHWDDAEGAIKFYTESL
ncbi:Alpha/Beta hydrolase protein [Mycena floridula]|nr:Alpha/Beta hydrolase protein [Mycena floridula]